MINVGDRVTYKGAIWDVTCCTKTRGSPDLFTICKFSGNQKIFDLIEINEAMLVPAE